MKLSAILLWLMLAMIYTASAASTVISLDSGWKFSPGGEMVKLNGETVLQVGHSSYNVPGAQLDDVEMTPGKTYKLSFQVRCKYLYQGGSHAYYQRIAPMGVANDEEKIYSISKFINSEEFISDSLIIRIPAESKRHKWQIQLFSRVTGSGLYYRDIKLQEVAPQPEYELVISSPAFRNNIYKSKSVKTIAGYVIAEPTVAKVTVELCQDDKVLQTSTGAKFSFAGADQLSDGQYMVRAELFDGAGKSIKVLARSIEVMPKALVEVIAGQDNNFYINGELFVVTFFGHRHNAAMRRYATANGVNMYMVNPSSASELEAFLDEARDGGWKIICSTPYFRSSPPDEEAKYVKEWLDNWNKIITPELRQRLELFGYALNDEPEVKGEPLAPLLEAYRQLREFDPYRPVWINAAPHGSVQLHREYSKAADIYGMDVYPVGRWNHGRIGNYKSLTCVGSTVALCEEAVRKNKPIWIYLQAYAWRKDWNTPSTAIYPDLIQSRFMFYDGLLNGATGFCYYGLYSLCRESFLPVLFKTTNEINAVSGLARGTITSSGSDGEIHWRQYNYGKVDVIIAANYSKQTQKATVKAKIPAGMYKVCFEDREVKALAGALSDDFEPYAVHVYANGALPEPAFQTKPYSGTDDPWLEDMRRNKSEKLAESKIGLKWIWARGLEKVADSKVWLTRQVVIRKPLKKATFTVTADNRAIIYVNQNRIGSTRSWNHPVTMDLSSHLQTGENFVSAHAWDIKGLPCGFIGMLQLEYQDGSKQTIYTDSSWRGIESKTDTPPAGDDVKAFAPAASELAIYGHGRWGERAPFDIADN